MVMSFTSFCSCQTEINKNKSGEHQEEVGVTGNNSMWEGELLKKKKKVTCMRNSLLLK